MRESSDLISNSTKLARDIILKCAEENVKDWVDIKSRLKDKLGSYLYEQTGRSPIILPIIMSATTIAK
jgi:ribonuclease J